MDNAKITLISTKDLRTIAGGSYYKLPVRRPICELPAPVQPGYPTTDPVFKIPPYYTK